MDLIDSGGLNELVVGEDDGSSDDGYHSEVRQQSFMSLMSRDIRIEVYTESRD
jgi:hypothetical protein